MRILKILEWIEETLIAYLLAGMVLVAFSNAVMRRLFNSGFFWSLETTLLLFLLLVLFGMSYAARKSLHIAVDAIVDLLPKTLARVATVLGGLLSTAYAVFMVSASYTVYSKYTSNSFLKKVQLEDIPVPVYLVYAMMVVCFSYLALTLLWLTWQVITGRRESITAAHEAAEEENAAVQNLHATQSEEGSSRG